MTETLLAELPTGWPRVGMSRLSTVPITAGADYVAEQWTPGDIRYVRTTDIQELRSLSSLQSAVGVSPVQAKVALAGEGDILMTRSGSLGTSYVHLSSEPICFAGYLVRVRPDPKLIDLRFMAWWTISQDHMDQIANGATRSTIDNFSAAKFRAMRVPLPPSEVQHRIADFLDRETALIDVLIEKQQALIVRVAERRDALWESIYSPLASEKKTHALRRLVHSIVDGPFGSSLTSSHYEDEGVRVIRLGNIGIDAFKNADKAFISEEYGTELSSHGAVTGDVVMAGLGDDRMPLGRAAVVPEGVEPAIVKADCYRLRPRSHVLPSYLSWALSSPPVRRQILDLARGATRARLNTGLAKMVRVACPPLEEQRETITDWNRKVEHLDAVTASAVRFIELARERRAALITAAVTGQLDVTSKEAA